MSVDQAVDFYTLQLLSEIGVPPQAHERILRVDNGRSNQSLGTFDPSRRDVLATAVIPPQDSVPTERVVDILIAPNPQVGILGVMDPASGVDPGEAALGNAQNDLVAAGASLWGQSSDAQVTGTEVHLDLPIETPQVAGLPPVLESVPFIGEGL